MRITLFFLLFCFYTPIYTQFTIMLDPLGDAQKAGRSIGSMFERGITLQLVQKIKDTCKKEMPAIRVILTRAPGESLELLQNASFANKLNVDLYLSFGCYHQAQAPSHIALYQYCADPVQAAWHKPDPFHLYDIHTAYLYNYHTTRAYGSAFLSILESHENLKKHCLPLGLFSIPCMPLQGIKSPALYIELGIPDKKAWKHFVKPLVSAIKGLVYEDE